MLCCCPQAICTIFFSSKPLTGTSTVVVSGQLQTNLGKVGFLTGFAFNVKTCPVSCGDMLPRTPVSKLALLSAPACINCENCEPSSFTQDKKRASRALSAPSEEQCKCDASRCGADVLQVARHRIQRPIYKRECADFRAGPVPALI